MSRLGRGRGQGGHDDHRTRIESDISYLQDYRKARLVVDDLGYRLVRCEMSSEEHTGPAGRCRRVQGRRSAIEHVLVRKGQ